jgi:hypothetical protein
VIEQKESKVSTSVPLPIIETASVERNVNRNISDLPGFKSIELFIRYSMRPTTAKITMTDVIDTARETIRLSILPKLSALILYMASWLYTCRLRINVQYLKQWFIDFMNIYTRTHSVSKNAYRHREASIRE